MMRVMRSAVVGAALVLVAGGCSEILGPLGGAGEVSFRYHGEEWGRFSVRGVRPDDWAAASHASGLAASGRLVVMAYSIRDANTAHMFGLSGFVGEPGSYAFSEHREDGTAYAELALDASRTENSARATYVLTAGTLVVEQADEHRIRGRFSAVARSLDATATLHISDGRFDVPNDMDPPVDIRGAPAGPL